MNDFDVSIKCKECISENVSVKAVDKYEGDIILAFICNDCGATETWGVSDDR